MTHREGPGRARRFVHGLTIAALCAMATTPAWAAQANRQAVGGRPTTTVSQLEVATPIQPSDWISKPTLEQVRSLLPPEALQSGLQGTAMLRCKILPTTAVSDCVVVSDTDPSHIVGDVAIKASALFKLSRRAINGTLVDDQWVIIPVKFDVKGDGMPDRGIRPFPGF